MVDEKSSLGISFLILLGIIALAGEKLNAFLGA